VGRHRHRRPQPHRRRAHRRADEGAGPSRQHGSVVRGRRGRQSLGRERRRLDEAFGRRLPPDGTLEGLPSDDVRPVFESSDGDLWVGTRGAGLARRTGGAWKIYNEKDGLPSDRVWALHQDASGDVWAGTKGGLARFHNGRWTSFTHANGLAADLVFAIVSDAAGDMWIGTVGGLTRYRDGKLRASVPRTA
jgi:hypothetical protein